jgi:hypothetical protein
MYINLNQHISQETFLLSVLQNESRCWTEFCKYEKRRKVNTRKYSGNQGQKCQARYRSNRKGQLPNLLLRISIQLRT